MNNITLDECFQFGLGAFETIGIEQGIPILLEKHLKRLERAADFLKLGDPAVRGITARRIEEYLEEQKKRPEVQKEFDGLEHCALKLMPVSYTHLDVYKRQVKSIALPEQVTAKITDGFLKLSVRGISTHCMSCLLYTSTGCIFTTWIILKRPFPLRKKAFRILRR